MAMCKAVTDLSALLAVFVPDTVHRLTTDRVIRRGESYRNAGAVEITALTTTAVSAEVQGTHRYEVVSTSVFMPIGRARARRRRMATSASTVWLSRRSCS